MDIRIYLVNVYLDTQECILGDQSLIKSVDYSIDNQQLILEKDNVSLSEPRYIESAEVVVSRLRSFEAAARYDTDKLKVGVLNFASSTTPGGGVKSGAKAQEECLCRCSTLWNCLSIKPMWDGFYAPHRQAYNALHNDDIIYTPRVSVIKDDDYKILEEPFVVDVITCAAPNLRRYTSNEYNEFDGDSVIISSTELRLLHEKRARRILSVAAANGVEVLILGAFGCGAFRNDPNVVAMAYKNVLTEFKHYFKKIEFAIYCRPEFDDNNYQAFKNTLNNP